LYFCQLESLNRSLQSELEKANEEFASEVAAVHAKSTKELQEMQESLQSQQNMTSAARIEISALETEIARVRDSVKLNNKVRCLFPNPVD